MEKKAVAVPSDHDVEVYFVSDATPLIVPENPPSPCMEMSSSLCSDPSLSPVDTPINSGTEVNRPSLTTASASSTTTGARLTSESTRSSIAGTSNNNNDEDAQYSERFNAISDSTETPEQEVDSNVPDDERCIYTILVKQGLERIRRNRVRPSTLYFIGNKSVGKSTIIQQLAARKSDVILPTLAIDFKHAKRNKFNQPPQVCRMWELGGSAVEHTCLLDGPIVFCDCPDRLTIVIVLDLSEPQTMWEMLETALQQCKLAAVKPMRSSRAIEEVPENINRLEARVQRLTRKRTTQHDAENEYREIFPIPLVIIGGKYDEFCVRPIEYKREVCQLLRLFAYKVGASICFYSSKQVAMNRRIKDFLCFYGFDLPFPSYFSVNPNEPLLVPASYDSFHEIVPSQDPSKFTFEYLKNEFKTKIGVEYMVIKKSDFDMWDPRYAEPDIDRKVKAGLQRLEEQVRARLLREEEEEASYTGRGIILASNVV